MSEAFCTREARTAGGFLFRMSHYEGGAVLNQPRLQTPYVCFVLKGAYSESVGPKLTEFRSAGTFHYHGPAQALEVRMAREEVTCLSVAPFGDRLDSFSRLLDWRFEPDDSWGIGLRPLTACIPRAFAARKSQSALWLESYALQLYLRLAELPRKPKRAGWIEAVRKEIECRLVNPPTLEELAELAGVHRTQVVRGFKAAFGCTPGEYRRSRQIDFAEARLIGSLDELGMIAREAGFSDQSHFTRCFRAVVGTTPGAFRDANR